MTSSSVTAELQVREGPEGGELLTAPKYYWGCCMVCRQVGTASAPLKRCAGCSCIFYCSREHQKLHWKEHKRMCQYLASAAEEVGADTFFGREFQVENLFEEDKENGREEVLGMSCQPIKLTCPQKF